MWAEAVVEVRGGGVAGQRFEGPGDREDRFGYGIDGWQGMFIGKRVSACVLLRNYDASGFEIESVRFIG